MDEATLAADAERRLRDLIDQAGLTPPDAIEHRPGELVFLWNETKTAVIIDLDDPPRAGDADLGEPFT